MNLENRKTLCDDIGYQLLFQRRRFAADELGKRIGEKNKHSYWMPFLMHTRTQHEHTHNQMDELRPTSLTLVAYHIHFCI